MYLWIAMCMLAHLAHVAFEISDHSPNFLDTPRINEDKIVPNSDNFIIFAILYIYNFILL
jgi:hypothetical protein